MRSVSKSRGKRLDEAGKRWREGHPTGRPKKAKPPAPAPGHNQGNAEPKPMSRNSSEAGAPALRAGVHDSLPRLLDLQKASEYLSMNIWTIRKLIDKGTLTRVSIPLPHGAQLKRVYLDRHDLDRLIDRWRDGEAKR